MPSCLDDKPGPFVSFIGKVLTEQGEVKCHIWWKTNWGGRKKIKTLKGRMRIIIYNRTRVESEYSCGNSEYKHSK